MRQFEKIDRSIGEKDKEYPYLVQVSELPDKIKNAIQQYCEENNCLEQLEYEFLPMIRVLRMYLFWEGIMGYHYDIHDIFYCGTQCKIKEQDNGK